MKLETLAGQSRAHRARWRMPVFDAIDPRLPFVPEEFTQLYHVPAWRALNDEQRLRYNQLFGLRSNELFMVFEKGVTCQLVQQLQQAQDDPLLAECLEGMLVEEARHHRMFLAFNRAFLPEGYREGGRCFSRDSALERGLLPRLSARPWLHPLLLWAVLVLEEFSVAFSRRLLERDDLEPTYRRLHEWHLKDEARHVQYDVLLLNRLMDATGRLTRRLHGGLFRGFFRQVLNPRHSGPNVIRYLADEFPELRERLPEMLLQVRALGLDPGLQAIMEDAGAMPLTHELLARHPGFRWF